jgi:hypothetical protein
VDLNDPGPSFGELEVGVTLGGLSLKLINDCLHTNIPIAQFNVRDSILCFAYGFDS